MEGGRWKSGDTGEEFKWLLDGGGAGSSLQADRADRQRRKTLEPTEGQFVRGEVAEKQEESLQ